MVNLFRCSVHKHNNTMCMFKGEVIQCKSTPIYIYFSLLFLSISFSFSHPQTLTFHPQTLASIHIHSTTSKQFE